MSISICKHCKSIIKNGIHTCSIKTPEQAKRSEEISAVAVKKETLQKIKTIPPIEINHGGTKSIPQSAVKTKTVRVLNATLLTAGSLANGIVLDGDEKRLACVFDSEFFVKRYITNKNPLRKPVTPFDFMAIIYSCGGPVPSMIKSVETKPDESGNWVCIMWRMK